MNALGAVANLKGRDLKLSLTLPPASEELAVFLVDGDYQCTFFSSLSSSSSPLLAQYFDTLPWNSPPMSTNQESILNTEVQVLLTKNTIEVTSSPKGVYFLPEWHQLADNEGVDSVV